MSEARAPVRSFPAYLAERRPGLAKRLTDQSTPTEAMHVVRELLDELLTIDLGERSSHERQVDERAVRIIGDSAGFLRAVRAEARWAHAPGVRRRPSLPWRILGLITAQIILGLILTALLGGMLQRGAAGGDAGLALALVGIIGLVALQLFTGYQIVARRRADQTTTDDRPELVLRVDSDSVISTLGRALVAVDQLEQAAMAPPDPAASSQPGLADYPDLLRAIQHVYAARLSGEPQRMQARAEALRASLEQCGIVLQDAWPEGEPPPPDLFGIQRSLDPTSEAYRVILPAVIGPRGVIVPGRVAAPAGAGATTPLRAGGRPEPSG